MGNTAIETDHNDIAIELPLVNIRQEEVLGALFVITKNANELYKDALLKLQTWIMNYAEEMVKPLRDCDDATEDLIEAIKGKTCVISPITLALYIHRLQLDNFSKMTDSEKERYFLERLPDRFKARYKGNATCRFARETNPEECTINQDVSNNEYECHDLQGITFAEFLRVLGAQIQQEKKQNRRERNGSE